MDSFQETYNNLQRLRSAGVFQASDRHLRQHCIGFALFSQEIEGKKERDQIAFCAFHLFLVEVQTNAGYIRAKPASSKPGPSCSKLG